MSPDTEIIKIPQPLKALDDLLPGDIILFVMPRTRKSFIGRVVDAAMRFFQSLVGASHGHQNIGHTSFIINDSAGKLKLAHLVNNSNIPCNGFELSDVDEKYLFFKSRSMTIYRMRDPIAREEFVGQLMSVITDREEVKKAKFRFRIVIESWLRRMANAIGFHSQLLLDEDREPIVGQEIQTAESIS